jgi:AcrR family transcriptional regulator
MHHFPTRQALIIATVEYAYETLNQYRAIEVAKSPPGLDRYRLIMDLSLVTQRMPEGMALNEIRIGSRSDPEIRDAVTPICARLASGPAGAGAPQANSPKLQEPCEALIEALGAIGVADRAVIEVIEPFSAHDRPLIRSAAVSARSASLSARSVLPRRSVFSAITVFASASTLGVER